MNVKTYESKLLKTQEEQEGHLGRVHALVSTWDVVDHDGDRMVQGAFKDSLAKWRERGDPIPFIWSHRWDDPNAMIGKVPPELARETDRGLEVEALIDLDEPASAKVYRLLKERRITQFSFAYDVLDSRETDEQTDRGPFGKVVEIKKVAIHECGPCLLGSNSETDLLEVAARRLASSRKQGRAVSTANRQRLMDAVGLIEQVIASDDPPEEAGRQPAGAKSAIASHSTATTSDPWDGAAAERNIPNDATASTYRRVYAWVDPDADPDTRSAYRFPHHMVSGDGTVGAANTRACSAIIAVLNGGRGGTAIPAGDRQGVYNHAARHLRDADMEPPELRSVEAAQEAATPPAESASIQELAAAAVS